MASTSGASLPPMNKLTCPICCDKFKQPKMLPCGHSFCDECVRTLLETRPPTCPVCRKTVNVTSIDQLPTNFSLKTLVESDRRPFEKTAMSRLFGECSEHGNASDRYCRSCEKQLCKDCVKERHASTTTHEVTPVASVVVEQRDKLETIMKDIYRAEKEITEITENVSKGEASCHAEASKLLDAISASADETNQATAEETESLKCAVERSKKDILEKVCSLRETCSELSLLVDEARDIGHSFHKDLETHNVSRSNVMESFSRKRDEVLKRITHLARRNNNFTTIGLKFSSKDIPDHVGKLVALETPVPGAIKMKTISLTEPVSSGFIWPEITWMVNLSSRKCGEHNFLKISNYHFLQNDFVVEIGISKPWFTVTRETSRNGRAVLCLTESGVHRFTFPSINKLTEPGEIGNVVFLNNVAAITWDENRLGCYALLNDGKTIMHLDMDGCKVTREVVKLFEKVKIGSRWGAQPMYVNCNGNLAVCDQQKRVIYFYEAIDSGEPPKVIGAPTDQGAEATPDCVMARKEDKLWYGLWKIKSSCGFNKAVLYAYDSSFEIMGEVAELEVGSSFRQNYGDNCSLCFQGDFVAIKVYDEMGVFHLT